MSKIYQNPYYSSSERAKDLLKIMTIEEKIGQMCQMDGRIDTEKWVIERGIGSVLHVTGEMIGDIQKMADKTRLKIPVLIGIDAIHGHAFHSGATVFNSQLSMACSWNKKMIERMAKITAIEVALTGIHWTFSPVLCIARDMRWGRVGETFGEDPYLISELGEAMIKGYQGESLFHDYSILACAKHFAGYGETVGGRDSSDAEVSRRKLREIFFKPFKKAVETGVSSIMAGYNSIDGTPCSSNSWLLKDVLNEWNFEGFVVTDWNNIGNLHHIQKVAENMKEASRLGIESGNHMMMSTPEFYEEALNLAKKGEVSLDMIDDACYRILKLKFELGLFDGRKTLESITEKSLIGCPSHVKEAYNLVAESIVMLKNSSILPLRDNIKKIAVIGPNADDIQAQLGDWSFGTREHPHIPTWDYHRDYDASNVVTVLGGLRDRGNKKGVEISYHKGCSSEKEDESEIKRAIEIAEESDIIIAVVGDTNIQNGEMRDRSDINLRGSQNSLLKELKNTKKPLITVLICGKPLDINWIEENSDGVLLAFNPGQEGGNAIADIIFGYQNPSGKLPISFPKSVGQQPVYYNALPGWHSDRYIELDSRPLYPFGYGLSYSRFGYSNLKVSKEVLNKNDILTVSVSVFNSSSQKGMEIVQLYVNDIYSTVVTPCKELKGFKKIEMPPNEMKTVTFEIPISSLGFYNEMEEYCIEKGEFEVMVGSSSKDEDLLKKTIRVS
ncbi:beta-glucosidase [Acetoanaerobium pronyense]|uniref:beta-glucosidase n=1 Tax=Acetoanaerobium pronyense TaxID=1482736 RepID=A0ABS4KGJ3_9FIRM|nr:glycoside hydrolase family 3 N-terminal domain-containing protein [Acetoanaerobium pronyense]MBP2026898.1 beta-glucosidase [Acetoanaerobium pronyense]